MLRRINLNKDEIYNSIKNIVLNAEQSVLFRQEGQTEFNSFVKEKQMYLNTGSITAAQFWVGNDDNTANYSISSGEIRMYGLRKN